MKVDQNVRLKHSLKEEDWMKKIGKLTNTYFSRHLRNCVLSLEED